MTLFARINILFITVGLLLVIFVFTLKWSAWTILPAFLIWISITVYGSANICSGMFLKAMCVGRTEKKVIALTFDDGPVPGITGQVLKILKEKGICATFFVIGSKAEGHPELVRQMDREGHLIGNHSYDHGFFFDLQGYDRMKEELERTERLIEDLTGNKASPYFRPPYGVTNPVVGRIARDKHYMVTGWTVRTFDSTHKDPDKALQRFRKKIQPGAIVLLHDNHENIAYILENIIKDAEERGYTFVRVDEMIV